MTRRNELDAGFIKWFGGAFVAAVGAVSQIGMVLVVPGVAWLVWLAWRGPGWPSDLGLSAGLGGAAIVVSLLGASEREAAATLAWLGFGVVLLVASHLTYRRLSRPER